MDVKFKIGDKVKRIYNDKLKGQEGIIIKIKRQNTVANLTNDILTIKRTNYFSDKTVIWHGMFCELVEESSDLCNCNIDILMAKGCQCKGN